MAATTLAIRTQWDTLRSTGYVAHILHINWLRFGWLFI